MTLRPILAIASEIAPLIKTGGLADVVGALPGALAPLGWGIRTLVPGYGPVMRAMAGARVLAEWADLLGQRARVLGAVAGGLDLLVLDIPSLYQREGSPYLDARGQDWPDNDLRFAALCRAGARIAAEGVRGWRPQAVHLHDWQAGLTPVYLRALGARTPCVLTIHNMAFHGLTDARRMVTLDLPVSGFTMHGFEYYGHVSALKAGLTLADAVTTVSPTYARELTTPQFGMGLDGVIRAREGALHGILNGIDTTVWNPSSDDAIFPYSAPVGKAANKSRLRAAFGLPHGEGPLCVVVSRLSDQKGLDLLLRALPSLTSRGGQLALLGSGDRALENAWLAEAARNPAVGVRIGYDETLAHQMFAGGDAVLVPSRFEPCGLTQLYGLRYAALPVVARTGGLADTVIHANAAAISAGVATGLTHDPDSVPALADALAQLCAIHGDRALLDRMRRNAMRHPVGWEASAPRYAQLYNSLTESS